jgi:hypothetical protein
VSLFGPSKPAAGLPSIRRKNRPGSEGFGAWAAIKRLGVSCFVCLIRGLIAVRWSACLKIRAGRATGLQSLALQFLSFRRGRQCPRFTIVSPHSGDCGARPVTRSVSALLTHSSRRRLNGFSGVSQYRVEDGPPPLLQRSRPKVPVDYSLVDGLSLVAGFHTSWSLCARARLVTLRQTFVRRCHGGWTASEPPHFSRNGTPPRDENRRCIPSNENWLR